MFKIRDLTPPKPLLTVHDIQPIEEGGTDATTNSTTITQLGLIPKVQLGQPNGIAILVDGKIPNTTLGSDKTVVCINGPEVIPELVAAQYTITNYEANRSYTITTSHGTITRSNDIIIFTPIANVNLNEIRTFLVDGKQYEILVYKTNSFKPTIVTPVSGSLHQPVQPTITSNAPPLVNGESIHISTDWQIATDTGFTNIVSSNTNDAVNKTSYKPSAPLLLNITYYVRCRYNIQEIGLGPWSDGCSFTTRRYLSPYIEISKLVPTDGATSDEFGRSVAISSDGNTAIVGAHADDNENGTNAGSAYIYTRSGSTWAQQSKLLASDGAVNDYFGISVSISSDGNTAIVGARGDDGNRGSAYIYTRSGSTWTQQSKLVASDGASTDLFGGSVSISSDGNTAIVGAYGDDSFRGSAYIYTRSGSTWTQQTKLVASDGATGDRFGYSVAISSDGNTAIVGAYFDDENGTNAGSAYVYTRSGSTWAQQSKLLASDGAGNDQFGYSVAISSDGNTAIVGAVNDDSSRGSAYIYTRSGSTWTQQSKLLASDGAGSDSFGYSVSISSDGNTAIVGAPYDDSYRGSAYIYTRTGSTWTEQSKLVASDGAGNDRFGISVAISGDGNTAIVGAYLDDDKGTNAGSAYIFY